MYPQDGDGLLVLQRNADSAMVKAKQCGRNRFQIFTSAMSAAANRKLEIETSFTGRSNKVNFLCTSSLSSIWQAEILLRLRRCCGGIVRD